MAILKCKTISMDYEMLLSGKNGFALKRYGRVWKLRNLEKLSNKLRSGIGPYKYEWKSISCKLS